MRRKKHGKMNSPHTPKVKWVVAECFSTKKATLSNYVVPEATVVSILNINLVTNRGLISKHGNLVTSKISAPTIGPSTMERVIYLPHEIKIKGNEAEHLV